MRKELVANTVYTFGELTKQAKEKARDQYRGHELDFEWWVEDFEDAKMCLGMLGIKVEHIFFSGFSSQGDGACFEAEYSYTQKWREEVGQSIGGADLPVLLAWGEALEKLQQERGHTISASTKQAGRYMHSGCMCVDVTFDGDDPMTNADFEIERDVTRLLREMADWVYRKLEKQFDYLMSDDGVDEALNNGLHEYLVDGTRYAPMSGEVVEMPTSSDVNEIVEASAEAILRVVAEQPIIGWRPMSLTHSIGGVIRAAISRAGAVTYEAERVGKATTKGEAAQGKEDTHES